MAVSLPAGDNFRGNCLYQPSFPRKRESSGDLPDMRHHMAVPFGIPAYAGRTVEMRGNPGKQELPQRIRQKPALSRRISAFI